MKKVFISYSHFLSAPVTRMRAGLTDCSSMRPLQRSGEIELWADTRIAPGATWIKEIETALAEVNIAVLLISADFLASEFIASRELPTLLRLPINTPAVSCQ